MKNAVWLSLKRGVLLTGLVFLLVTLTPLNRWYSQYLAGPWSDPRGEILIVLGGSVLEDGLLGINSYWRSVYAARIWREGGFRQVLISGGNPPHPPVALSMRDFLVALGVPAEAILLETESRSTKENARFAKRKLAGAVGVKILLTSDYHMFRAHRTFRKEGVDVLPRPFPDAIKQSGCIECRWPVFVSLVAESTKIAYYFSRGWI